MTLTVASSLVDVCFTVCTALETAGTVVVLTGGSAATFYAPEAYQSRDADFIITMRGNLAKGTLIMNELGFSEKGGIYVHRENPYTVEFPPGPLAVGDDLIASWDRFQRDVQHLNVLTRTDCVRDRLTAFYFYHDQSALAAALAVASGGPIDLALIQRWSGREGEATAFQQFKSRLST